MNKVARAKKVPEAETVIERYLEKHGLTQEEFGKKLGVSQGMVWQWIVWLKNPKKGTRITVERAKEISDVTDDEIKKHELRPDFYEELA